MNILITRDWTGGWNIQVPNRRIAERLCTKIQDACTLLYVDNLTLRYGVQWSTLKVKGDERCEEELECIVNRLCDQIDKENEKK